MKKYVALLRGINVSGQKLIKMVALKSSLESQGFQEVVTYIQSGNIVFKYQHKPLTKIAEMIHDRILEEFGFDVPTIVVTADELDFVINENPFHKRPDIPIEKTYVTFLENEPHKDNISALYEIDFSPEEFVLDRKYIFLHFPVGIGKAKMSNNWFEKKLKLKATTRNWNTVNKLFNLSK